MTSFAIAKAHCHLALIQVFTAAVPFNKLSAYSAMIAMARDERPPRPTHPTFTDSLWQLMQRCWDPNPQLRLEVSEVLQVLLTL